MKKLKLILAVLLVVTVFTSCEKEGPQGPEGPAGPQGPNGEAQINDYSKYISGNDWIGGYVMPTGGHVYYADIAVSFITSDIKNNGVVLVYRKISYSGESYSYAALPYSEVYNSNSTRLWSFEVFTGAVRILIQNTDDENDHNYGGATFRIVAY
jgi:hypothetical protein